MKFCQFFKFLPSSQLKHPLTLGSIGLLSFSIVAGAIAIPLNQQLEQKVEFIPQQASFPPKVTKKGFFPTSFFSQTPQEMIWPTVGKLTQGFHPYHEGIDIAGPVGTPILAAKKGRVREAGWDVWGLGNRVTIDHQDGSYTVYGHNNKLLVSPGQLVESGQTIATMGNTGNSTGPHLHFEYYGANKKAIDPLPLLQDITQAQSNPIDFNPKPNPINRNATQRNERETFLGNICQGEIVIDRETRDYWITICQQKEQLFYLSQSKNQPENYLWLSALEVYGGYRADHSSYSYLVRKERIDILQNGQILHSEAFL